METLFDTWNQDNSQQRNSILLQNSGTSNDTVQNMIDTWFTAPSISDPVTDTTSQGSFWDSLTGKVKSAVTYLTTNSIIDYAKDITSPVATAFANTDTGQAIKNKAENTISFFQSGLFKALAFIVIAVILFFMAKGFLTKKGMSYA